LIVTGVGKGVITSDVGDISCDKEGGVCSADIPVGSDVTLTPTADTGYFFNGWQQGIPCLGAAPCTFTVDADTTIRGSFVMTGFISTLKLDGSDASGAADNIWTILSDGTSASPVTKIINPNVSSFTADWSPDGTRFAYTSNRNLTNGSTAADPEGASNIWVSNADGGGGDVALTRLKKDISSSGPQWSPDGSRIAYISNRLLNGDDGTLQNQTFNLWVVNADGSGGDLPLTKLTGEENGLFAFSQPSWSPDGKKIAYVSVRSLDPNDLTTAGTLNIWIVNADGSGGDQSLTQSKGIDAGISELPQWSPDGTKIFFSSTINLDNPFEGPGREDFKSNIWTVNPDGSGLTALTRNTNDVSNFAIAWSPDGTAILFVSNRNLDNLADDADPNPVSNIWTMRADGTQLVPATRFQQFEVIAFVDWAPDGKSIIFDSEGALNGSDAVSPDAIRNLWKASPDGGDLIPITTFTKVDAFMLNIFSGL
jgi:Tol biopolymer transport system component